MFARTLQKRYRTDVKFLHKFGRKIQHKPVRIFEVKITGTPEMVNHPEKFLFSSDYHAVYLKFDGELHLKNWVLNKNEEPN